MTNQENTGALRETYFGGFSSYTEMVTQFMQGEWSYDDSERKLASLPEGFPLESEVLFASYGLEESYEGDATIIYRKDGHLFIVTGGHCSCRGLEGQWKPVETTKTALFMMWNPGAEDDDEHRWNTRHYNTESVAAFRKMVRELP